MAIKGKKGQTEDILGDFLFALFLSVVGVVFLILAMGYVRGSAEHGYEEIFSFDVKNDLMTFLNSRLDNFVIDNEFRENGLREDSKILDFFYFELKNHRKSIKGMEAFDGFFSKIMKVEKNIFSFLEANPKGLYNNYLFVVRLTSFSGEDKTLFKKRHFGDQWYTDSYYFSYDTDIDFKLISESLCSGSGIVGKGNIRSMNYDGIIDVNLLTCRHIKEDINE